MTLFLILISLVGFSLVANVFSKHIQIFVVISILIVFSFYFFLSKNFFQVEHFYPNSETQAYIPLVNYYNILVNSLKNHKLYIVDGELFPALKDPNIYENYKNYARQDNNVLSLFDTSFYNGKIYLYFGITPILLFYLPFNLITNLYLTDKCLVFMLSCFIFLLSLFLLKKISENIINIKEIPSNIIILSIFFIGFCNYAPFLLIRSNIYEVAITTSVSLLFVSFMLFYYCNNTKNSKQQNVLIFLLSLALCLIVGARPHYVLFIPVFFFVTIGLKYKGNKNIRETFYSALIFLIPCLIYGTIIALYNYFRFDSIFEFGFKYTLNEENHYEQFSSLKDVFLAIKYDLFQIPDINKDTIFSLVKTEGHLFGNEFVAGIIWSFPLIFLFVLIPSFLIDNFKKNKNIFYITLISLFVIITNIFVTSFIGIVNRYFFEYMPFIVILSIFLFYYLYNYAKTNRLKKMLNIFFVIIFVCSVFVNICLLFSENNSIFYAPTSNDNYVNIINFLFK